MSIINEEKIELENRIKENEKLADEKEQIIMDYKQALEQNRVENEKLKSNLFEMQQKDKVIQGYVEGLKAKYEELKRANFDMNQKLADLSR